MEVLCTPVKIVGPFFIAYMYYKTDGWNVTVLFFGMTIPIQWIKAVPLRTYLTYIFKIPSANAHRSSTCALGSAIAKP